MTYIEIAYEIAALEKQMHGEVSGKRRERIPGMMGIKTDYNSTLDRVDD